MNTPKLSLFVLLTTIALVACKEEEVVVKESNLPKEVKVVERPMPVCSNCGTIRSINPITVKGTSTGAGGAIGAVVGGVLGHQVGGGRGKDIATVVGVVGGAVAGNEIEKKRNATTYFDVTVSMDNGGSQTLSVASTAGVGIGSKVKVVGNNLELL